MDEKQLIKIGTRGSALAMAQTKMVCSELEALGGGIKCEVQVVRTSGDSKQNKGESIQRDKKDWIFELEEKLLGESIDLAVHSAKDVPVDIADGTELLPVMSRESASDILIPNQQLLSELQGSSLSGLKNNLRIGTASLRRKAQLLKINPKLKIAPLRGNINTRIKRLSETGDLDGIVLAQAGVSRLGVALNQVIRLNFEEMVPAVNQGILLVQFKSDKQSLKTILGSLVDPENKLVCFAERAVVANLEADCSSSLGVYAWLEQGKLNIKSRVLSELGDVCLEEQVVGEPQNLGELADLISDKLLARGAAELL